MTIKTPYISKRTGLMWNVEYEEMDSFESIKDLPVGAVGAFCFYKNKLVLGYSKTRDVWEIPGGGCEEGESFEECITREIKEESNMKVLELIPLGYERQINSVDETEKYFILRYAAKVEPYGEFKGDTATDEYGNLDDEITAIKLIDPKDYKQYFDWGERSEVLIEKAIRVLKI